MMHFRCRHRLPTATVTGRSSLPSLRFMSTARPILRHDSNANGDASPLAAAGVSISSPGNFWTAQPSSASPAASISDSSSPQGSKHRNNNNNNNKRPSRSSSSHATTPLKWTTLAASSLEYTPLTPPIPAKVASLRHGLDRVLFNPGVHFLQDPRSGVYNFDPYLQRIAHPDAVDFNSFAPYITASQDPTLLAMAKKQKARFISSTSSISGALSHMYFMISGGRPIDISRLSHEFVDSPTNFTVMTRAPATILLKRKRGPGGNDVWTIDADKSHDKRKDTILSKLGKSMEHMLTSTRDEFARRHLLSTADQQDERPVAPEAYAYGRLNSILLRAQLDCADPRLPRTTFDLKTRAALAIRMDQDNYQRNTGYHIQHAHGLFASFEREYFDMIRSAFLKYALQVRIGHMDGIMVAFHNTQRIFGFQYISLEEMDASLFGGSEMGDQAFKLGLGMLEDVLARVVDEVPATVEAIRVTLDTKDAEHAVYAEVLDKDQDPNDMRLEKLDPKSPSFHPPQLTRWRVYSSSVVNGDTIPPDCHPDLRPGDKWSVRYAVQREAAADSEHVVWDYYGIRFAQYAQAKRNNSSSVQVQGKEGGGEGGEIRQKRIFTQLKRYYVDEAAEGEAGEGQAAAAGKKIMYVPRHPAQVPLGKRGVVLDDGWALTAGGDVADKVGKE